MPELKKYDIRTVQTVTRYFQVEAEDPEDAEDLALNWPEDCDLIEEHSHKAQMTDLVELG